MSLELRQPLVIQTSPRRWSLLGTTTLGVPPSEDVALVFGHVGVGDGEG